MINHEGYEISWSALTAMSLVKPKITPTKIRENRTKHILIRVFFTPITLDPFGMICSHIYSEHKVCVGHQISRIIGKISNEKIWISDGLYLKSLPSLKILFFYPKRIDLSEN